MRKKVVIFGKAEAGKSTLIRSIIPEALNVHHKGRTIALDFGSISYNGYELHFFGTPGQARFDCLRDIIGLRADLSVMVFDGSRTIDREDQKILEEINELGTPFIALLNLKPSERKTHLEDVERLCRNHKRYMGALEGDVLDRGFVNQVLDSIIANL